MNRHSSRSVSLVLSSALFCSLGAIALTGCAAESADLDSSEADLTTPAATVAPLLADVLSGGDFRCAQPLGDIRVGGDVVVHVAPASASDARWSSATNFAGSMRMHAITTGGPFALTTGRSGAAGSRSVNTGDIGHGYYCGGGTAAYNCGPDRTDTARFFVDNGSLRCEITSTQDEMWSNNVTYSIKAAPIRLSGCFNEAYYLASNPDVASKIAQGTFQNGRDHFDKNGRSEGRQGCACEFDEAYYLASNPDVVAAVKAGTFLTGRHHYAKNGAAEGRAACP